MSELEDQLRAWAKGMLTYEAATELLIRGFDGRFAGRGKPWVIVEDGKPWINFESIPEHVGALSGGERRYLRIAASLADYATPVSLGDSVPGMDKDHMKLILAAIAHVSGWRDLYPWPDNG